MAVKSPSAAIYSPVDRNALSRGKGWTGESFYIDNEDIHIEEGIIHQKINGANKNEVWLFSCNARKVDATLKISFFTSNEIIYTKSEHIKSNKEKYFSVYSVGPDMADGVFVRVEGTGIFTELKLSHLKVIAILNEWEGDLKAERNETFEGGRRTYLEGKAQSLNKVDNFNMDSFGSAKIFVGFLNGSMMSRVEGKISSFDTKFSNRSDGPIMFEVEDLKMPIPNWT